MIFRRPPKTLVDATRAALLTATLCAPAFAFDTDKVMNAIKFPNKWKPHKVLISHRGIVGPGCPENSACSLTKMNNRDIAEAIELDIKSSANGTLWLFHDLTVGRMLEPSFDIYGSANQAENKLVSKAQDYYIRNTRLVDKDRKRTAYFPVTLTRALGLTKSHVAILDLKTEADARRAARIVKQVGAQNRVILKVSAAWYTKDPRTSIEQTTRGTYYAVTLYGGDQYNIHKNFRYKNENFPNTSVNNWIGQAVLADQARFMFLELGIKQWKSGNRMYGTASYFESDLVPLSQFVPVPEYRGGYVRSNGTCCADLSAYLTPGDAFFRAETVDDRPNMIKNGAWKHYDSILTDDIFEAHKVMFNGGARRLGLMW